VEQEDSEGVGQEDSEGVGGGDRRMGTQMLWGRSSMRTWCVQTRSTVVASQTMMEGRVMGLLQAQSLDNAGSGGATLLPLLYCLVLIIGF
jgi:hypothetical protein